MAEIEVEPSETDPTAPSAPRTRSPRWIVIAFAAAVLAVGGVFAAAIVIVSRDDGPSYDTAQIGWMHQSCEQWADSHRGDDGPDDGWCTAMTDWMNDRTGPRRGGMMGPAMWQDPDAMRATCQQWTDDNGTSADDDGRWCDQMVDWMSDHMGDWDRWMRDGPMTGGS